MYYRYYISYKQYSTHVLYFGTEYLCDLIRFNVKSTRASFDPCLLCVPPISKMCVNSFLIDNLYMLFQHCGMPLI